MQYKTTFKTIPLADIVECPYNPRVAIERDTPEYDALRRSLEQHEVVEPLVVNIHNMRCVGGNQRLAVMRDMGITEALCSIIDQPDEVQEDVYKRQVRHSSESGTKGGKLTMNLHKSKIEWCTHTWNPVTGCLHGCPYCYARRFIDRFKPQPCERPEPEPMEYLPKGSGIYVSNSPCNAVDDVQNLSLIHIS